MRHAKVCEPIHIFDRSPLVPGYSSGNHVVKNEACRSVAPCEGNALPADMASATIHSIQQIGINQVDKIIDKKEFLLLLKNFNDDK